MPASKLSALLPLALLAACEADPNDSAPGDPAPDTAGELDPATVPLAGECSMAQDLGGFTVQAIETYSTVAGSVSDGVVPMTVLEEVASEGGCRALQRNNPFCDPPCGSDETCDFDGACLPYPETQDLGTVTISGLTEPVSMEPVPPGYTYFDTSVGHPAYEAGALVTLRSSGGRWDPITLHAVGLPQLVPVEDTLLLVEGEDLLLHWDPPADPVRSELALRINIDQHGTSPISLYCSFEDDGEATVPASMVDLLVNAGVTGYPSGTMSRRTVDSVSLDDDGCMDFTLASSRTPDVRVDGFTPCHDDEDCPDGQECNEQLEICE
jgi:hypothetical protein